ncbi:MAG: DUF4145 domain-containing protein [Helcococcus sp.]|nr:DUF4145 domain-containing protein [Helcococcus sp.]
MEKYSYHTASCNFEGYLSSIDFRLPKTCVHCNETMTPQVINQTETYNKNQVAFLVRCSHCKEFFAISYIIKKKDGVNHSELIPYSYNIKIDYDLSDEIELFSPDTKEIYMQSKTAEAYNLSHIAGIGYRKSIEFLIKDFLINVKDQDKATISNLHLSQAIDKIDNDNIKTLAKASTWIGNDETHYIKKHPDKDVNDLKKFLKALSQLLSSEYLVKEALSIISENSSSKSN